MNIQTQNGSESVLFLAIIDHSWLTCSYDRKRKKFKRKRAGARLLEFIIPIR